MEKAMKYALVFFLYLGVFFLGYRIDLQYQYQRYAKACHQGAILKNQIQIQQHQIAQLTQYQHQRDQAKAHFNELSRQFLSVKASPQWLEKIALMAQSYGIKFTPLRLNAVVNKGFYQECAIPLSFSGKFESLLQFFKRLSQQKFIFEWGEWHIYREQPAMTVVDQSANIEDTLVVNTTMKFYCAP